MREYIRPALVLLIICLVISAALAVTYSATKDAIAEGGAIRANTAMTEALPVADDFEMIKDVVDVNDETESKYPMITGIYRGYSDGTEVGFVVSVVSKGYGGDILVMIGVGADELITGVRIVSHTETPGLGAKADTSGFYSQFDNKGIASPITVVKGKSGGATDGYEISSISGATITSRAVTEAVNAAVAAIRSL